MSALPRRPFLGLRVRPAPGGGLLVLDLVEGATAAASGVCAGDVVERVNGEPVRDAAALTRLLRGRLDAMLTVRRGARALVLALHPVPFPLETHPRADISLSEIEVEVEGQSARWRTLLSTPRHATDWAILFVGGIRVDSLERRGAPTALDHILSRLAQHAVTLRVERGVGDSEGPGPERIDFHTEACAYRSALEMLRLRGHSVAVFGHSIGGMHAPRLPADARVVYGSSAARWSSCLAESTRRQLRLRDPDKATKDAERNARRFNTTALRERPRALHEQLDAVDLAAAWRRCPEPALVMHGEYDWVVGREESEAIAELAPNAEHVDIPGADHAFSRHPSLDKSLRHYGRGEPADEVVTHIRAFLLRAGAR